MRRKSPAPPPKAPAGLSPRSAALWRQIVATRARSAGRLALLEQALRALDRADEARALVNRTGLLTKTTTSGAVHLNPLAKLEREMRAQFLTAWGLAGFEWDQSIDGMIRDQDEDDE